MSKERIPGRAWRSRIACGFLLGVAFASSANAIPGGTRTSDYAYVGAVYYDGRWGSGVAIAPGVVLTAGHVVEGVNDSKTPLFLPGTDPSRETNLVFDSLTHTLLHPLYETRGDQYDIGLLFLTGSVALPRYAVLSSAPGMALRNEPVDIVGYGGDLVRKKVANDIDDLHTTDASLYVIDQRGVVEPGDSGGGLFIEREGQARLAGITSWTSGAMSGFASVSYYRNFIDQHVSGAVWMPAATVPQTGTLLLFALGLAVWRSTPVRRAGMVRAGVARVHHRAVAACNNGSSTGHTVSKSSGCASSVGWMRSGWKKFASPMIVSRKKGTSAAPWRSATRG